MNHGSAVSAEPLRSLRLNSTARSARKIVRVVRVVGGLERAAGETPAVRQATSQTAGVLKFGSACGERS